MRKHLDMCQIMPEEIAPGDIMLCDHMMGELNYPFDDQL